MNRRIEFFLFLAAFAALIGCNDAYAPTECKSDDECLAPRSCVAGYCLDPAEDALDEETATQDAIEIPDVPAPELCFEPKTDSLFFGDGSEFPALRQARFVNCGNFPVTVSGATIEPLNVGFEFARENEFPAEVESGEEFSLTLAWFAGDVLEATLSVQSDAAPAEMNLFGTLPPAGLPCLNGPTEVSAVGRDGQFFATLTINNCGESDLQISLDSDTPFELLSLGTELQAGLDGELDIRMDEAPESGVAQFTVTGVDALGQSALFFVSVIFDPVVEPGGILRVEPLVVDFGTVRSGLQASDSLLLCNDGTATISISSWRTSSETFGFSLVQGSVIPPLDCIQAAVTFDAPTQRPGVSNPYTATLTIGSNAQNGDAVVELRGVSNLEISEICVDPARPSYEFRGTVDADIPGEVQLDVCGDTSIVVTNAFLEMSGPGLLGGTIESVIPGFDVDVRPSQNLTVELNFGSSQPGLYTGFLRFEIDGFGELAVPIVVIIDPAENCPDISLEVARSEDGPFTPSATAFLGETLILRASGADGLDPELLDWTVLESPGPAELSFNDSRTLARFSATNPTATGVHVISLQYADAAGCSDEATASIVVSDQDADEAPLTITMTWETPGDPDEDDGTGTDVDLHMVEVRRAEFGWNDDVDCYYENTNAEWGAGTSQDNCRYLRDDDNGFGPEVITINRPSNNLYVVGAHYYSARTFGPSTVSITVHLGSQLVGSASITINNTGEFWPAFQISEGGRGVTAIDAGVFDGFITRLP